MATKKASGNGNRKVSEKQILDLERKYWDAIKDKDGSTATSLSDDPCVVVGAQGVGEIDKRTLAEMMEGATYELNDYEIGDFHVRPISDDVVVAAYKVSEELTVDGEDVSLEAFDSSVWVRKDGDWVCVLHTESLAGDPFGRD